MKKGSANSGDAPLSLGDISPHCGESPSNSLPKTFSVKFCPYRALFTKVIIQSLLGAPYMGKINIKSLWKGVRGDSPWDGEMSEGQRGRVPVRENLSSERFAPIKGTILLYIPQLCAPFNKKAARYRAADFYLSAFSSHTLAISSAS